MNAFRTVWDPTGKDQAGRIASLRKSLRLRGTVQSLIGIALGTAVFFFLSSVVGVVIWVIAVLSGLLAVVSPLRAFTHIQNVLTWIGIKIGTVITFIVLVPLFYTFFFLFGIITRRGSGDRLERRFPGGLVSYWKERSVATGDIAKYKKQF